MLKKNILFIITSIEGGGAERALLNLLSVLDTDMYNISLFLIFRPKDKSILPPKVNVIGVFDNSKDFLYRFLKQTYWRLSCSFPLKQYIRNKVKSKFDVIISFLEGDSLLYHSFVFDKGKKNISWVHTDFTMNHWSLRHLEQQQEISLYNKLDKIVFVSQYTMQRFKETIPLNEKIKLMVMNNVINEKEIQCKSLIPLKIKRKSSFVVCSVGRMEYIKGYDRLIRVAANMKKMNYDVEFWLVGTGSQDDEFRRLAKEKGASNVVFFGFQENPYNFMKNTDLFVSPSVAEGYPLVLCEAQCLGLAIVATKNAGSLEILDNGKLGIITEQTDEALESGIEQMLQSNDMRIKYSNLSVNNSLNNKVVKHIFNKIIE